MLISVNEKLSVQKYSNLHNVQWICYEPLENTGAKKRNIWKKMTGLMSTCEMRSWISKSYPGNDHAMAFQTVAGRTC